MKAQLQAQPTAWRVAREASQPIDSCDVLKQALNAVQSIVQTSCVPQVTLLSVKCAQALAGQLGDTTVLWQAWMGVWGHFQGLPEQFTPSGNMAQHPTLRVR